MKIKGLWVFIFLFVFLVSCDLDNRESNLETLVSYMKEIDRDDLSKIIKGSGFRAEIIYKDEAGKYQPLTLEGCYRAFVEAGYDRKFSYQFCEYLIYTALNKVLEKRKNQLEPQIKAFIEEYRNYIKDKENTLQLIKKVSLYSIPFFFAFAGLITGIGIYKLIRLREREDELNNRAIELEKEMEAYIQERQDEGNRIIENARREASEIVERARQEARDIKTIAFNEGYAEGQERHKKELKSLRNRISAIRNIFKTYPQLNECFRRITGKDFEKWLKER